MQPVDTRPRAWTYGRRKCIPIFLIIAPYFAWQIAVGHLVVFNLAMLGWGVFWAWRYWVEPIPPRLAARIAKNAGAPRFGHLLWHKIAIGLAASLALLFAALIIAASIAPR
jgi:hypothetical protein